jgi:hypothetical protein
MLRRLVAEGVLFAILVPAAMAQQARCKVVELHYSSYHSVVEAAPGLRRDWSRRERYHLAVEAL